MKTLTTQKQGFRSLTGKVEETLTDFLNDMVSLQESIQAKASDEPLAVQARCAAIQANSICVALEQFATYLEDKLEAKENK